MSGLIACVAIIGRQGEPLYVKSFVPSFDVLSIHAALDAVRDKVDPARYPRPSSQREDPFLGLLYPIEGYKIFGFITNTNIVIVIAIKDTLLREDRVRALFDTIAGLHAAAVCNPFSPLNGKVTSPRFEEAVYRVVEAASHEIEFPGSI